MPIIERPAQNRPESKDPAVEEIAPAVETTKPSSPQDGSRSTGQPGQRSNMVLLSILALFIGILIPMGSYYLYTRLTASSGGGEEKEKVVTATVDISLNLERLVKLGSLASLSRKEFEVNVVSLQEAEKNGSSTVFSALEIVVNKKRQELAQYKEKLIALLMELNEVYTKHSSAVVTQFNKAIAAATTRDSAETSRILKMGIKILEGAPSKGELADYMKEALEDNL